MNTFHTLIVFLVSFLFMSQSFCLAQASGDYFYRNFTAQDMKASDWIQSIAQDSRGIIYAGNNLGTILEYDGSRWRTISATNGPIRSLKADSSGRIYVGSFGEFGYLEPDKKGAMQYRSLMEKVGDEDKNISDVWSVDFFGRDVYFRSVERLFRYRDGQIKAFTNPYGWFGNLIVVEDQLFVSLDYNGTLLKMNGDTLEKFYESKEFDSVAFGASARYSMGKKLVGSWGGGLFVFCPENINKPGRKVLERLQTPEALTNKNLLRAAEVYPVDSGIYAARTNNGITVFDKAGGEIAYLNTNNGLNSSLIETIFSDKNQVLWIGTEKGITRIDISSPMSTWYSISEKTGTIWGIISYNESIYFWGVNGIYRLNNKEAEKIHDQTYGLVEFHDPGVPSGTRLLAINSNALVEIKNNRLIELINFPERLLYQQIFISKHHPDRIYLYGANGLHLIRFNNGRWKWEDNIAGINVGIQSFTEDSSGDLWLAVSNNRKLIRLMPQEKVPGSADRGADYLKQLYDPPENVAARWIRCFAVNGKAVFGTDKGLFRFNPESNRFMHVSTYGKRFTDGLHAVYTLKEGPNGSLFIADRVHRAADVGLSILQEDGTYSWYDRPFLAWTPHIRIYDAAFDSQGSVWMVTDEGINKFDPSRDRKMPGSFNTLIREVITGKDSLLFYGNYPFSGKQELTHHFNSMKFEFSALSYEGEDQNMYQYILEGFDKEWSDWTPTGFKEYSNLPDGDYKFRVKARNIYGIESDEAQYHFAILPPWYRTIWAYVGYLLILILIVYSVIILNLKRLRQANFLLEKSVQERTEEIMRQKEEIATINENLLVQQEELKTTVDTLYDFQEHLIKSEKMASLGQLIAGVAHEINSPLGAIKASVSDISNNTREILLQLPELIKKLNEKEFELFLQLVTRSTQISIPANSKEERLYKKSLQKKLEDNNLPDAAFKADTLVDMGIHNDIDAFISILGNGNSQSLQVAYSLSQLIKNSKTIETAIDRASKMVQALKHYSHNAHKDERVESNITEGIITVLTLFQNQMKYKIHLTTEFEPLPNIICYPDELNQVWTNLITNAIDAMEGKGKLSITVSKANEWVIIKISDSGNGIPKEVQPRLFDAFFSTKPAGEGSGLGLFLTKEIIDKHGGKIVFETEENTGTTFTVSLPLITRVHKN
jgi:signal transduction histidine kinase